MEAEKTNRAQCMVALCNIHTDEHVDLFCFTCGKKICTECMRFLHNGHQWEKIEKVGRIFRHNISSFCSDITDKCIPERQAKVDRAKQRKQLNSFILSDNISRLQKQRELLHREVEKICDSFCESFKAPAKIADEKLQQIEDELTKDITELENTTSELQDMAETASNAVLFDVKLDVERRLREHRTRYTGFNCEYFTDNVFYVEGEVNRTSLQSNFGRMIQNDPHSVVTIERGNFVFGLSMVLSVAPVSERLCWIYSSKSQYNTLVNDHGDKEGERDISGLCSDFVVLENGDHVLTYYQEKCIKKVDENGKELVLINTAPLMPVGISLSLDKNLLITAEDRDNFDIDKNSRRVVQHITIDGNIKATYEIDSHGKRLFTYPTRVRQNYNGDLCVVDLVDSTGVGRVCIFTTFGYVKSIYRGHNKTDPFLPTDILCDRSCNIIISDLTESRLHLLCPNGNFIKFISTQGLQHPQALGLYKSSLWIGGSQGQIRILNYRYYIEL